MAFEVTEADRLLSRGGLGRSEKGLLALAAVALSLGVAAWITDAGQGVPFASAALPGVQDGIQNVQDQPVQDQAVQDQASFRDRFLGAPVRAGQAVGATLQGLDRAALNNIESKLWDAKAALARQLMYSNWRSAAVDEIRPSVPADDEKQAPAAAAGIPLPRPRPVVLASADPQSLQVSQAVVQADAAPAADNRTLVQKLSDLLPGKVTLASLAPDGGLFRKGPNLAALGYDHQTAVYDLSARAVYLPNGMVLEAHSGIGSLRDDPEHVDRRMVGATPPATYDLKPREQLFHGVAALRMTPADGATIFGRAGLLVHPFMLGPLGDSNGCVSVRDYDRFLKAYNDGEVTRLVVVRSLNATATSQRAAAQASPS
jgi:hypothetical protein